VPRVHRNYENFNGKESYGNNEPRIEATDECQIEGGDIGGAHDDPDN
jgi:hypothetical protein